MKTIIKMEKKTRDHKSVKEKIEIVQYAIQNSNRRAEDKYGVGRQSIRDWRDKLPELLAISNKSHKSTLHPGRKPETVDIENEIVEWILMNRSLGVSISSWEVIIKACSLKPELNQKSIGILKKWWYKFLKRHFLTFRAGTHIGQKLPDSYSEKMRIFTKFNENLRKENDFDLDQIANIDETPLFMNIISKKTIAKIGSKEVIINTHGQERVHVTAILWIVADGTKLPPMLVFKGISGGRVEKRIQKHSLVKDRKIFAYCQPKAWNNEYIMRVWISEVWRKYCYFKLQKDTMLVMDDASMHKLENVRQKIKDCHTEVSMIPAGLTRYLQPLDVSINKPFKDELRKKYTKYCIDQEEGNTKVSQEDLINWVWEVWYSEKLSQEIIKKSFKIAGITLNIDGSEDEMFIGYNEILGDDQEMVEEVEKDAVLDNKEEIKNSEDNYIKDNTEEDKDEEPEYTQIELIHQEDDLNYDANTINFKFSVEEQKDDEESNKDEIIKEIQRKADEEIFPKRVSGGLFSYYNIKPKEDKFQKRKSHSK